MNIHIDKEKLLLIALLLICFVVRFPAIYYSLPDGSIYGHTKSYFNDEDAIVVDTARVASSIMRNPLLITDPGQTTYPIFGRIVSFVPLGYFYLTHLRGTNLPALMDASPQERVEVHRFITFSGRLVSLVASFFTILVFVAIGNMLRLKRSIIWLLAITYAFIPVDIGLSIEAKSNALLNLILLTILYLALRWQSTRNDRLLWLAALLVGVAVGTQLNGLFGSIILLFVLILGYHGKIHHHFKNRWSNLVIFILPFCGLLLSSPHILLHPRYALRMVQNAGSGSLLFSLRLDWNNIVNTVKLLTGGWIGTALFLATIVVSLVMWKKITSEIRLILLWFLFYFTMYIQTTVPTARYAYPLLPLWLLLFGTVLHWVYTHVGNVQVRRGITVVCGVWALYVIIFGLSYISLFQKIPLQIQANRYVEETIPFGTSVAIYPDLTYYRRVPINQTKYHVITCRDILEGKIVAPATDHEPAYIIINPTEPQKACAEELFGLSSHYTLVKEFTEPLTFGPFRFQVAGHWKSLQSPILIYQRSN